MDTALERNNARSRSLPDEMVVKMWKEVQDNLGKFQKIFGVGKMLIVDNSSTDGELLDQIEKQVIRHLNTPVQNPLGKRWLKDNDPKNRNRNLKNRLDSFMK